MKLWLVSRTDKIDYDEYDSFVIRSKTAEHAICIAQNECRGEWIAKEISTDGAEEVILGSFNAG